MYIKRLLLIVLLFTLSAVLNVFSQPERRDSGQFIESKNEFWNEIKKANDEFNKKPEKPKLDFKLDFSKFDLPKSKDEFKYQWHNEPISQGATGTCWDFSTISFMESEAYRLFKRKFKFSEMYTDYWEYVEKARRFVQEKGNSEFGEGSEANAVTRIWKKYGCLPENEYTGLKPGQKFYDHEKMFAEMDSFLKHVKKENMWNEDFVLSTIKSILNSYMGEPPQEITIDGKKMTPLEYLKDIVKLNMDDYVEILSLMEKPYWEKVEYVTTDNWWHSSDYYNVPLDDFMTILKTTVKNGYTTEIGGDVSEPGYDSHLEVALVPSFDIPHDYIDENARQFRFSNKTTTDDHGIHIIGYEIKNGDFWFLIKDSGSGSFNAKISKGYRFYEEDYIKLKMLCFLIHKSAVEDYLKKFK